MDHGDIINDDIDAPVVLRVVRSLAPPLSDGPLPHGMSALLAQVDKATRTSLMSAPKR